MSKTWKDFASTSFLWLAHQVAKGDVEASEFPLLDAKEMFKQQVLTYDIWEQFVLALEDVDTLLVCKNLGGEEHPRRHLVSR